MLQVNGRLHVLQGYTRDFHATDSALLEATPRLPPPPTAALSPAESALIASAHSNALAVNLSERVHAKMLLTALEESQRILEDRRSYPSLAALQALVQSHREVEGRKFIFYFCSGINANSDARELLQSVVSLANRVGVTIYVVDLSPHLASMSSAMQASQASSILGNGNTLGGMTAFGTGRNTQGGSAMDSTMAHNIAGFEFGAVDLDQSPLVTLSAGTGGMYFNALDDSKQKLQQLHEELSSWYQLPTEPTNLGLRHKPICAKLITEVNLADSCSKRSGATRPATPLRHSPLH